MNGIDISKWQTGLDLKKAKADHKIDFAIIKIGGGDSGRYKDSQAEQFYQQAKNAGLRVGFYYFGNELTVEAAVAAADFVVQQLKGKEFDLPVYYDIETKAMLELGKRPLTDIAKAFCETIRTAGYKPGIYMSTAFYQSYVNDSELLQYSHWVADWRGSKPFLTSGANVDIWQTGSTKNYQGTIEVDNDIAYVDFSSVNPKPQESEDWITMAAREVWEGKWGNGEDRKNRLYQAIQARVNELKGEYLK